jgi:hypothetical protein
MNNAKIKLKMQEKDIREKSEHVKDTIVPAAGPRAQEQERPPMMKWDVPIPPRMPMASKRSINMIVTEAGWRERTKKGVQPTSSISVPQAARTLMMWEI